MDADRVPTATGGSSGDGPATVLDSSSAGGTGTAGTAGTGGELTDNASTSDADGPADASAAGDVDDATDSAPVCSPGCKGYCVAGELAGIPLASCCTALGECGLLVDSQTSAVAGVASGCYRHSIHSGAAIGCEQHPNLGVCCDQVSAKCGFVTESEAKGCLVNEGGPASGPCTLFPCNECVHQNCAKEVAAYDKEPEATLAGSCFLYSPPPAYCTQLEACGIPVWGALLSCVQTHCSMCSPYSIGLD